MDPNMNLTGKVWNVFYKYTAFPCLYIIKVRFSKQKKLSESVFYDIDVG